MKKKIVFIPFILIVFILQLKIYGATNCGTLFPTSNFVGAFANSNSGGANTSVDLYNKYYNMIANGKLYIDINYSPSITMLIENSCGSGTGAGSTQYSEFLDDWFELPGENVSDKIKEINENRAENNIKKIVEREIEILYANGNASGASFTCWFDTEKGHFYAFEDFTKEYNEIEKNESTSESMGTFLFDSKALELRKSDSKTLEAVKAKEVYSTLASYGTLDMDANSKWGYVIPSGDYEDKIKTLNNSRRALAQETITKKKIFWTSEGDVYDLWFEIYYDEKNNEFLTPASLNEEINELQEKEGFWGSASEWFGSAKGSYTLPEQVNDIIDTFSGMINVVGTAVIVIATIVLGIKYMIGTVDSKVAAKEGLITLLVACVFFFGWTAISNLLYGGDNLDFIFTSESDSSYTDMVGRIFNTFTYIVQFVAVGAIIFIGIKYIFAGAEGRAELKGKSIYFIIGIILVFATTNVLSFISKIINEAI